MMDCCDVSVYAVGFHCYVMTSSSLILILAHGT